MAYKIHKNDTGIIEAIYSGGVDLNERKMAVDEVCELVNYPDPVRLLIDVRNITMEMSLKEQKYFGKYLAGREELVNAKVAVLHNPRSNPNVFINAYAYIEGYQVVDFDDQNNAISWLTGEMK